jgi:hypothetical protein
VPKPAVAVYLEAGNARVFACALDWPGWCRRAKTDEAALDALAEYVPRYGLVAKRAGLTFVANDPTFEIVERIPARGGTTFSAVDFGALAEAPAQDREPLSPAAARRLVAIVEASWAILDGVVAGAPERLRKGPRGGGRDRDAIFAHVVAAEASYARKVGVRHPEPGPGDADAIMAMRADLMKALRAGNAGEPLVANGWLPRYAARRIAWHVLDHAWEIEDKSEF